MSFADGHVSFDDYVKVDVEGESHFAKQAFVQAEDTGDVCGDLANLGFHGAVGGNVAEFLDRRSQLLPGVVENYERSTEGGPAIGRFPTWAAKDGDGNANESKCRGEGITFVVPGVTFDREASNGFADGVNLAEQKSLDDEDAGEHDKGVRLWRGMRGNDFTNAFIDDDGCSHH